MTREHLTQPVPYEVLEHTFDVKTAVGQTVGQGYYFAPDAITPEACRAMEAEAGSLNLRENDKDLINPGTSRQVVQSHERAYLPVGAEEVPVATFVTQALVRSVERFFAVDYPELGAWQPTEAGYQRYRSVDDGISPHRDRKSDQLLAVTITVNGSAPVKIYEPLGDPYDYTKLRQTDEFQTGPGSVMLLKASGLGDGCQTIHEAFPPGKGSRLVLNLRMRPDVLGEHSA